MIAERLEISVVVPLLALVAILCPSVPSKLA